MFSSKRRSVLILPALVAALGLAGCTSASAELDQQPPSDETSAAVTVNEEARALLPADVREKGVLVFASDPTYPPFEYMDTDNKTLIGFDIELTDLLAASLGLEAEHTAATFDTILPGLTSGKYDVGVSQFSITPQRQKAVDFVPYQAGGTAIAVATGNPQQLALTDGSLCGRSIAAQKGSIQALTQAPEFSRQCVKEGKQPIDIQTFPGQSDANLALISGRVEAIMSDSVSLAYQGKDSGGKFEVAAGEDYEPTGVGMAVKEDSDLYPALSRAMNDLLASAEYNQLFEQWEIPASTMIDAADFSEYSK